MGCCNGSYALSPAGRHVCVSRGRVYFANVSVAKRTATFPPLEPMQVSYMP
jgi:hypothetical protein